MADEVLKPQQSKPNFLLRALIAFFFFIVIPILPSIAPDFLNLNLLSQSWELLHIVFVGIAVSYGLFSRRYSDSVADSPPKSDSPHSYVSRLLQASSVFDDDVDSPTSDDGGNHSKIQTWSSQYFRNDPMVVVANEKQIGAVISDADHKPLLLPVRSLKSRVSDDSRVYARSNSEPPNWNSSSNSKSELESVVLPSPIPWRSRSGRLEKKKKEDEDDDDDQVVHHLPPMEPKRSEDLPIKKAIYRPPPPPPPPPMPLFSKSSSIVKSCRTVRSRSWKESDEEEEKEEEEEELKGNDFLGEVHATSDDDDDDDDNEVDEVDEVKGSVEEMENGSCSTDVDKKADEFIAKFREQIRLQRIESIKRSTVQFSRSNGE